MMKTPAPITDFAIHRDRELRRFHARRPKRLGDVLAQLITARGYGRVQSLGELQTAWQDAVGDTLARASRPGRIRRGVLEITAGNSTIVQELTFQRQSILANLQARLPDAGIRDMRIRVGAVD